MEVWGQTSVSDLYDRAKAEERAAAELREFRELETEEEAAFSALLATRAATKASAIACVKHVADCGRATDGTARLASDDGGIAAGVVNEASSLCDKGGLRAALFV